MFTGRTIRVQSLGEGLFELCFDREASTINKLDTLTLGELQRAVQEIAVQPGLRGVLISSAKNDFIVGADITEFPVLFAAPQLGIANAFAESARYLTAIEDLPVPTVAAINGFALGGGFEVALCADYRVMSTAARVGFPEVNLGIFPGLGGTVRLPRVANPLLAVDWIIGGAQQGSPSAVSARAVDEVSAPESLREAALTRLRKAAAEELDWRRQRSVKLGPATTPGEEWASAFAAGRQKLAKQGAKNQPAGLAALELMQVSVLASRDAALRQEAEAFAEIAKTQAASSLIQLFQNEQLLKKKIKAHASGGRAVRRAAVLGAGIMGGGISYTSAVSGTPAVMKDINQKQLDLGMAEARKLLAKQVSRGQLQQERADATLASIAPQLEYDGFDTVDVVVEAVVENLKVKSAVLAEVETKVREDAIVASNTSSLRIDDLAEGLRRPENFVGMHFFNPVPAMPLVEIVRGRATSEAAVSSVVGYAVAMGKTPIVVRDGPGFLVNRILTPYMLGFLQLVGEGADFANVDRVMEQFGWPMGPAYLNDVIGLDTATHVFSIVSAGFPKRMQRNGRDALHVLVEAGRLGQKSGEGFYKYTTDPAGKPKKALEPDTYELLRSVQSHAARSFTDEEIVERLMVPMIAEAAWCLQEDVVASPNELDTALLLGLGLPRYLGGALKYADWLGLARVVQLSDRYAHLGEHYRVPESMRAKAAAGSQYYSQS